MPADRVFRLLGLLFLLSPLFASAASIDTTNHYAWNDNGGWINWNPANGNVAVTDSALTGYIWSADFGWINLAPTNGGVTNNGQGVLGGYAWGQNTGWINFTGVTIDSNGIFHGSTVAQSVFGTMTFNCTNCLVQTAWRPVSSGGSGSTSNTAGGGGGVISGPLSIGYQAPTPSATTTRPNTAPAPSPLTPSTPPSNVQPTTKPTAALSQPSQLIPGIALAVSATSSVMTGTPLPVSVSIMSSIKRTQPIAISYRLYPASGIVVYTNSGTIAPSDPLRFTENIPTGSLTPDTYTISVTAAYGTRQPVIQTLHVSVIGMTPTYTTPAPTPTSTIQYVQYTAQQPSTSWVGSGIVHSLVSFFTHLFGF
jgi:hypothetical protein